MANKSAYEAYKKYKASRGKAGDWESANKRNNKATQTRNQNAKKKKKKKITEDPRNSAPKQSTKPTQKRGGVVKADKVKSNQNKATQARTTTAKNKSTAFSEWANRNRTEKGRKEIKKAIEIAKNTNALGGRVKTQTGGSKQTASGNLQKVANRTAIVGELEKRYSSADEAYKASKDPKTGKHSMTRGEAKQASEYWQSMSTKEKRDFIKKNFGKDIKKADKEIDKANDSRVTKRDATQEEYQNLQNALRTGNGNSRVMRGVLGEQGMRDWASRTAYDYTEQGSRGAMGFVEGMSFGDNTAPFRDYYSESEKNAIRQGEQSKAYLGGYMGGVGANFFLNGVGSAGSALAKGSAKQGIKAFTKEGMKKRLAKQVAKEVVADNIVSAPLDLLDAYKTATDVDGNFDKSTFAKTMALNVGMNTGIGGLMSGGGALLKGKKINTAISLKNKLEKGMASELTNAERKLMNEINARAEKSIADDARTGYDQYDAVMNSSKDLKIAERAGENKNVIDSVAGQDNIFYHAGNLGKSESFGQQSGGRDTGAFGYGTYFSSDLDALKGYNSRDGVPAPLNAVDKSEYNLYRPKDSKAGMDFHEALRGVNNEFRDALKNKKVASKVNEIVERYNNGDKSAIRDLKKALPEDVVASYERKANEVLDDLKASLGENAMKREYKKFSKELESLGLDAGSFDEFRIARTKGFNEAIDNFNLEKQTLNAIEDDIGGISKIYSRAGSWVEKTAKRLKEFFPDKSEADIAKALEKAQNDLEPHMDTMSAYKQDSASTILMKELGYEGVDVSGLKGLDNTQYGSVIYDLKPPRKKSDAQTPKTQPVMAKPETKAEAKADADAEAKPKKAEAKEKTKAQEKLDKAEKAQRGADKHIERSKKVHGGKPSERALAHKAKADKQVAEAKKEYAESGGKVDKAQEMKSIKSVEDLNASEHSPKIGDPNAKPTQQAVDKLKQWTDRSSNLLARAWQFIGDDFQSFEKLSHMTDAETGKLIRSTLNRMRNVKTQHALAITGKREGQVNFAGKKIGESLDNIYKKAGLKTNGKSTPSKFDNGMSKEADFDMYCRLKSNLDLLKSAMHGDSDAVPFMKEFPNPDKETIRQIEGLLKQYEGKYGKQLTDFQSEIVQFARNDMQYLVDGGVMTADKAKVLSRRNPNYVPTYRVQDIKDFKKLEQYDDISAQGALKKREGSDLAFAPLYNSLVARNAMYTKKAELNNLLKIVGNATTANKIEAEKLANEIGEDNAIDSLKSVVYINKDKTGQSIASYFDGETMVNMPIPEDAVRGLKAWSGEEQLAFLKWQIGTANHNIDVGDIARTIAKGNRLFKDLITGWNPIFGAKNVVRDTQTALVNTQYGVGNYIRNYGRAVYQMMNNGDLYKAYKESGGLYSTMIKDSTEGFTKISKMAITAPIRALEAMNNAMETIPRFTEYCASAEHSYIEKYGKKSLKNLSPREKCAVIASKMDREARILAISDAKEVTVNFARSGALGRLLNASAVPYFNPALQGLYKLGKTGRVAFQKSTADGLKYIGKLMAVGAGASVLYEEMMRNNEEYQQLSSYTKNTYYCIPIGDGHFLKVPKARDLSAVSTIPNHLFRAKIGTKDGTTLEAFKTSWEQVGAVNPFTDNIASPVWRLHTGKNWYGEDLETEDDKLLIAMGKSNQVWDENTSQVAVAIGNLDYVKKMGLSPKKIDSLLDGYGGMIYDLCISQSAISAKEYGRYTPFINNFVVDSIVKNRNSQDFYLEADKHYKTMKYYEENNLDLSDKKYKEAKKWVEKYSYEASTITRGINEIQMDKSIPAKKKYQMLRDLKRTQSTIQKAGMDGKDIKIDTLGAVADVIGIDRTFSNETLMHRSKDTDGSWKQNTWFDSYASLKKSDAYAKANANGKKKLQKDYYAIYKSVANCEVNNGGSSMFPDYTTLAIAYKTTKKNADGGKVHKGVTGIFKDMTFESTQKKVDEYVDKYGGSMKSWGKTYKALNDTRDKLDVEYTNDLSKGEKALGLVEADAETSDREYFITGVLPKTTPARWGNKDGVTTSKLHKFIKENNINQYTDKEEIQKAIGKASWIKGDMMKAEVFALTYGYFKKNTPYGTLPQFDLDGDIVEGGSSYGGHGRRGWGHRGWGHRRRRGRRGGGGGSSKGGEGSYGKWLKANGYNVTTSEVNGSKSNLTEAFRKRQLKNLKNSTGRYETK